MSQTTLVPEPLSHIAIDLHVGRSWTGHPIEDACGCRQHACGLVTPSEDCGEHGWSACKTIRQGHRAADCPANADESCRPTEAPHTR